MVDVKRIAKLGRDSKGGPGMEKTEFPYGAAYPEAQSTTTAEEEEHEEQEA